MNTLNHTKAPLAWIGLGAMGLPMCGRLLSAGYEVNAYDPDPAALARATSRGASSAASLADAVTSASVVVSSIPGDHVLKRITLGEAGIFGYVSRGATFIDTSTVSPSASEEVAQGAKARGIDYVRCAVSGTGVTAEAGALTLMVSGPREAYERHKPILDQLGTKQFYLGEGEEARLMKLVVNLLIAVSAGALAEALVLGEKAGLDWQAMLNVIESSAAASPMYKFKMPLLRARDYKPQATTDVVAKDLSLILQEGLTHHMPLPLAAQTMQLYSSMIARGRGQQDYISTVPYMEELGGIAGAAR